MFKHLNRDSKNGYETGVIMHYITATHYQWELARYPLNPNDTSETETIAVLYSWDTAAEIIENYLANNPNDGFWDI